MPAHSARLMRYAEHPQVATVDFADDTPGYKKEVAANNIAARPGK